LASHNGTSISRFVAQRAVDIPLINKRAIRKGRARLQLPVRLKITLPYLILAVIMAVGSAYVLTQIIFDNLQERFTRQLTESAQLASERMVGQEDSLLRSLRLYAYSLGVAEAIQEKDPNRLQELALGIAANQKDELVEFLDAQGNLVLSLHHRYGGGAADYDSLVRNENDYASWTFVRRVLNGEIDARGDKFGGVVESPEEDFLYTAGPVYNREGDLSGVVLVGSPLDLVAEQMNKEILARVTFYNMSGLPVASTLFDPLPLPLDLVKKVHSQQDQSSQLRPLQDQSREVRSSYLNYDELLSTWEVRDDEDMGVLGVALEKNILINMSRINRLTFTGLVAVALLLVILVGVNIANFITRPLLRLVEASAQVANGDLTVQVEPQGNDEVTELTYAFNDMVSSLYESKVDLLNAYNATLEGWSMALELRDRETEGHAQRVAEMTLLLAHALGLKDQELIHVWRGALLHDIGKMGVPDSILLKQGRLTQEEWEVMRRHPVYAYEMLWPIDYLRPAVDIPYAHHERWNGTGYPRGLSGEDIPLPARIFAVIDVWDAMRSDRPYRAALSQEDVCQFIWENSGVHFDPVVVDAFFKVVAPNCEYVGSVS
jgi:HD-GYP domain-containing protein (c-di-GMP phosphodiesterase class II)